MGKTRSGQKSLIVPFHYIWDWPLLAAWGYGMGWSSSEEVEPKQPCKAWKRRRQGERESQREIALSGDVLPRGPWLTMVGAEHTFQHSAFQHLGRTGRDYYCCSCETGMVKQKTSECPWGCWSEKLNSNYPPESLLNGNSVFFPAFLEVGGRGEWDNLKEQFWFLKKENNRILHCTQNNF